MLENSLNKLELMVEIQPHQLGMRLDQALAEILSQYSRSRIKTWILDGHVQVNGTVLDKPKERVLGGEKIRIDTVIEEEVNHQAENIPLNIVYEDDAIYHYPDIANVPRAGIVHRLDKDTTGLMVVAKTIEAQTRLVESLQLREITREYEAVAMGIITAGGTVDEPITRHPTKRTHMAVFPTGKPAVTHYRVMERYRLHTRLRLRLETGRTHQIRVHMAHIAHPLIGDPLYGGRPRPPKGASQEFMQVLRNFDRQALHATMLRLFHPITGEQMQWDAPIPEDMQQLIKVLQDDTKQHQDELDW